MHTLSDHSDHANTLPVSDPNYLKLRVDKQLKRNKIVKMHWGSEARNMWNIYKGRLTAFAMKSQQNAKKGMFLVSHARPQP